MRNFSERRAEIFRRSENRIKAHKRTRIRVLACCIPLCLCVVILSVIYLPEIMFTSDKNSSAEDIVLAGSTDGASGFVYTSVEIINNNTSGNSKKEDNFADIENIYNIIQSSFITEDKQLDDVNGRYTDVQKAESAYEGENHSNSYQSGIKLESQTEELSYTITFNSKDKTQAVYTLNGNKIIDKASKQEATLTDKQLSQLQKALGLVIAQEEPK